MSLNGTRRVSCPVKSFCSKTAPLDIGDLIGNYITQKLSSEAGRWLPRLEAKNSKIPFDTAENSDVYNNPNHQYWRVNRVPLVWWQCYTEQMELSVESVPA